MDIRVGLFWFGMPVELKKVGVDRKKTIQMTVQAANVGGATVSNRHWFFKTRRRAQEGQDNANDGVAQP